MISYKESKPSHGTFHFDMLPFIALMMIVLATLLFITMTMASLNIGIGAAEGWIPSTKQGDNNKIPILVEWDGETAIIQKPTGWKHIDLGKTSRDWWAPPNWEFKNDEMLSFLNEMINKKETHYVLFAVRPSGFDNFSSLVSEFRNNNVNVGYEPIEQGKRIRLKLNQQTQK